MNLTSKTLFVLFYLSLTGFVGTSHAEIYQWVDEQGRVHFSDKRGAKKDATVRGETAEAVTTDGFTFNFAPQADALLSSTSTSPQGKSSILTSGYWTSNNKALETKSLLKFDLSPLLQELNTNTQKRLADATIELYANTLDKFYGQGVTNRESPGHSTLRGDNAFYLKPSHNNWQEETVTWSEYYSSGQYTPVAIRKLPAISAPGSEGVPDKNYRIDVTELLAGLILAQQREITLELTPLRKASMAQVTFYSREASPETSPRLVVNLK